MKDFKQTPSGIYYRKDSIPKELENELNGKVQSKDCKHKNYEFPDPKNPSFVRCKDCGISTTVRVDFNPNFKKTPGRNALCNCGSGKKFKKCCMKNGVKKVA